MAGRDEIVTVPLHAVAHGRAGDKGNRLNISIIAYEPETYALLAEQVTPERVLALFAHRRAAKVLRYDLPLLHAFNFVIDDVLAVLGAADADLLFGTMGRSKRATDPSFAEKR